MVMYPTVQCPYHLHYGTLDMCITHTNTDLKHLNVANMQKIKRNQEEGNILIIKQGTPSRCGDFGWHYCAYMHCLVQNKVLEHTFFITLHRQIGSTYWVYDVDCLNFACFAFVDGKIPLRIYWTAWTQKVIRYYMMLYMILYDVITTLRVTSGCSASITTYSSIYQYCGTKQSVYVYVYSRFWLQCHCPLLILLYRCCLDSVLRLWHHCFWLLGPSPKETAITDHFVYFLVYIYIKYTVNADWIHMFLKFCWFS